MKKEPHPKFVCSLLKKRARVITRALRVPL
jgi:hypothetical protein